MNNIKRPLPLFLIGPASVGKSSVGKKVAQQLGFGFVDIDLVFCDTFAPITDYIKQHGYVAYCQANSALTDELLASHPAKTVFATPAGFLAHEESPELVAKHLTLIAKGTSILLLPSEDPEDTADELAQRQTARWPEATHEGERKKYITRHGVYKNLGDIKIIGQYSIDETVELIIKSLDS